VQGNGQHHDQHHGIHPAQPNKPTQHPINPAVNFIQFTITKKALAGSEPLTWKIADRRMNPVEEADLRAEVVREYSKGITGEKALNASGIDLSRREQIHQLVKDVNEWDFHPGFEWVIGSIKLQAERNKKNATYGMHVILKREARKTLPPALPKMGGNPGWKETCDLIGADKNVKSSNSGQKSSSPPRMPMPYAPNPPAQPAQRGHPGLHNVNIIQDRFPEQNPGPAMGHPFHQAPQHVHPQPVFHDHEQDYFDHGHEGKQNKKDDKKKTPKIFPINPQKQHKGHKKDWESSGSETSFDETSSFSTNDTDLTPDTLFSSEAGSYRTDKVYHNDHKDHKGRKDEKGYKDEKHGHRKSRSRDGGRYRAEPREHRRKSPVPSPSFERRREPRYHYDDVDLEPAHSSLRSRRDSLPPRRNSTHYSQHPSHLHERAASYGNEREVNMPVRRSLLYNDRRISGPIPEHRDRISEREYDEILLERELRDREIDRQVEERRRRDRLNLDMDRSRALFPETGLGGARRESGGRYFGEDPLYRG